MESLAPPLCLLGDDPAFPFETVQITVGSASDDLAGNHSLSLTLRTATATGGGESGGGGGGGTHLEPRHSGGRGQSTERNNLKNEGSETRVLNMRT